jgi:hypothetical protein
MAGSCDHSAETLGSIKGRYFLGQLSDHRLLKDSALWTWCMTLISVAV